MVGTIVHEWISDIGGSERVFFEMISAFPDARVHVLWDDRRLAPTTVSESWIAHTPLRHCKAIALPLMLPTWRYLGHEGEQPDWILASSHLFAHHAKFRGRTRAPKLVYAHTPARYIWAPELDGRGTSALARVVSAALKPIDAARAKEATAVAANSDFVRRRIRHAWGRDADVIFPPVEVHAIREELSRSTLNEEESAFLDALPHEFVLAASRFVSYKRLDYALRLADDVGVPIVVAGSGPEETHLREFATSLDVDVQFVIAPSTALLRHLYARASVFVFPPIEDFGIMPVEAMAAGTPVLANALGGTAESVGRSDRCELTDFADSQTSARALRRMIQRSERVDLHAVDDFDAACFRSRISAWLAANV